MSEFAAHIEKVKALQAAMIAASQHAKDNPSRQAHEAVGAACDALNAEIQRGRKIQS